MPRSRSKSASAEMPMGGKCGCNPGWMVVKWILSALGIWVLVGGFATQLGSADPMAVNYTVLGWYFAGLVLLGLGKMAKWKGCCSMHCRM